MTYPPVVFMVFVKIIHVIAQDMVHICVLQCKDTGQSGMRACKGLRGLIKGRCRFHGQGQHTGYDTVSI